MRIRGHGGRCVEISVSNWILAISYINHYLVIFIRIKSVHVGLGNSVHDGGLIYVGFLTGHSHQLTSANDREHVESIIDPSHLILIVS